MSQLSEKELSALNDLLTEEELLIKKFQMLAEHRRIRRSVRNSRRFPTSIRGILTDYMRSSKRCKSGGL